jgi:hypothetical protein
MEEKAHAHFDERSTKGRVAMDLAKSIEPNSAQVNAEDFLTGPRTVTITNVEEGSSEQPVFIHIQEFPNRTYRPSKSMRRVIVAAWGSDSSAYTGRQLVLFCNPEITFGKDKVGGIQIASMSHIDKPLTLALTATRGKRKTFTVQPLTTEPPKDTSGRDWLKELSIAGDDIAAITTLGTAAKMAHASEIVVGAIRGKYKEISQ